MTHEMLFSKWVGGITSTRATGFQRVYSGWLVPMCSLMRPPSSLLGGMGSWMGLMTVVRTRMLA